MSSKAIFAVAILAAFAPAAYSEPGKAPWPPPGVAVEPALTLHIDGFRWGHEIQIALPPSYSNSNETYPVLWVTDGSQMFERAVHVVSSNARKDLPPMIVVAVGMPRAAPVNEFQMRRTYDFMPHVPRGFQGFGGQLLRQQIDAYDESAKAAGTPSAREQGGAPKFLEFLVDQLRPQLQRRYRMSNEHVLFGDSAGGFFCTYALFSRPQAFAKYVCGSPSLYWGDYELFRMEERYAETHNDLPAGLFFGAGEAEVLEGGAISAVGIVSSMARMAEILKSRGYPSLKVYVRIFPGETHETAAVSNLTSGLRTLWETRQ